MDRMSATSNGRSRSLRPSSLPGRRKASAGLWPKSSPATGTRSSWSPATRRSSPRRRDRWPRPMASSVKCARLRPRHDRRAAPRWKPALRRFGLYADMLVNNAALMTGRLLPGRRIRRSSGKSSISTCSAVVDLTRRFLPGMIARRQRRRAQRRLGRRLHAGALSGDLRRRQGLRALVQPRARLRDHGYRRARLGACAGHDRRRRCTRRPAPRTPATCSSSR